jgi:hypothetical protein
MMPNRPVGASQAHPVARRGDGKGIAQRFGPLRPNVCEFLRKHVVQIDSRGEAGCGSTGRGETKAPTNPRDRCAGLPGRLAAILLPGEQQYSDCMSNCMFAIIGPFQPEQATSRLTPPPPLRFNLHCKFRALDGAVFATPIFIPIHWRRSEANDDGRPR